MPRNKFWDAATVITEMMNPDARLRDSTFKMNMMHLSMLCGKKAQASGGTVYAVEDVVEAYKKLKEEFDPKGFSCNLLTLLKGTPKKNIDRLLEVEPAPPVYDSFAHSSWVRRNARRLKKMKWCYNGWAIPEDQESPQRLSYKEVELLGLLPQ